MARRSGVDAGKQLGAEFARAPLVCRAARRVQKGDRDRLDALGGEPPARIAHSVLVELRHLVTLVVRPLLDSQAEVARDEGLWGLQPVIVGRLTRPLAERERVAKAVGAD